MAAAAVSSKGDRWERVINGVPGDYKPVVVVVVGGGGGGKVKTSRLLRTIDNGNVINCPAVVEPSTFGLTIWH